MSAGKALAAFAVAVGGALGAFADYTFGWHDGGGAKHADTSVTTVRDVAGTHRVIRLRYGDVVLRPEAATQCLASEEGGRPNLFCTRLHGGRHQVIFYSDSVLVWPLDCPRCGPDASPFSYPWTPYVLQASRERQSIGKLELRDLKYAVTYWNAIRAFGKSTSCRLLGDPSDARASRRSLGVRLRLATLGGPPPGRSGCTTPRAIYIHSA